MDLLDQVPHHLRSGIQELLNRCEQEKQRADQEKQRADQEKQRGDQEKQRGDRAEEEIKKLKVEHGLVCCRAYVEWVLTW